MSAFWTATTVITRSTNASIAGLWLSAGGSVWEAMGASVLGKQILRRRQKLCTVWLGARSAQLPVPLQVVEIQDKLPPKREPEAPSARFRGGAAVGWKGGFEMRQLISRDLETTNRSKIVQSA